jgi:hypothetical protein
MDLLHIAAQTLCANGHIVGALRRVHCHIVADPWASPRFWLQAGLSSVSLFHSPLCHELSGPPMFKWSFICHIYIEVQLRLGILMLTTLQPRTKVDKKRIRSSAPWGMILQYSKAKVKLLQSICSHESIYSSKAALNILPQAEVRVVQKVLSGRGSARLERGHS